MGYQSCAVFHAAPVRAPSLDYAITDHPYSKICKFDTTKKNEQVL
jgi:hypothetical protein